MKPSPQCLSLIMEFEGCSLTSYPDPASPRARLKDPTLSGDPWTVGYGTTGSWVREGVVISPGEASRLLQERVEAIGRMVERVIPPAPTQGQLDALVSLCYNIGQGAFRGSTLLRLINEKRPLEAADEFLKWTHAGGVTLPGLVRRREAERKLFLSSYPSLVL